MAGPCPRSSARLVAGLSRHVTVRPSGVRKTADLLEKPLLGGEYDAGAWKRHELHPKTADEKAAEWIFLVDTLNFSFWAPDETSQCRISFRGVSYTGYWALCAAVNRAQEKGIPVCHSDFYSKMTEERMRDILRSDSDHEMPLVPDRCRVLREAGAVLKEKFGGKFVNVLSECEGSARKLIQLVVENFPSYRDEATYKGHRVCFYKRAQILVGDVWACFEGKGLGYFKDVDVVTVFADYRIPQLLLHLGALEYSEELTEDLKKGTELENGSEKEVEIRGCTIWAAEKIVEELRKRTEKRGNAVVNSILVDYFLWDYRREHREETDATPFHRTRCIYY
ncbi:queuosine salvage protein-like isoform X2 [Centruroides sculpturatus]|uniref:queuosine salvage protein-like isoform X2 n=1 Tax=Centruroides sculpturatus TaxID=218467 RepID=UPI000C6CC155|nr:queuosine salvage protein-like isoform X2 [Centruroides sculpturatus]